MNDSNTVPATWTGPSALIGHSGFVGGNLDHQAAFDDRFRSTDIDRIAGREYSWIACAGAPGVKWKANKEPERDREALRRLKDAVGRAAADRVVLISTVDVYPEPRGVDEDTPIDRAAGHPYGRNRLELEDFFTERFDTLVVRLPGLFGPGLKKNLIYDFLHGRETSGVHHDSVFQFYDTRRLWGDVRRAWDAGLRLVNLATEPVSVAEVAREGFGFEFVNDQAPSTVRYDMRTRHAGVWGLDGPYVADREQVMSDLVDYLATEGWVRP